jgi:DNA-binding XRE family transcriptional regulator
MDLGLGQRRVAKTLGANPWTYLLWEHDRTQPTPRFVPAILQFLGYDPFAKGATFPERLRAARRRPGLTQAELAQQVGLSEGNVYDLAHGRTNPQSPAGLKITGCLGTLAFQVARFNEYPGSQGSGAKSKKIRCPSGDHCGLVALPPTFVSWWKFPSAGRSEKSS